MTQVILGKSRVREICMPGSVRAKAKWLSYSTIPGARRDWSNQGNEIVFANALQDKKDGRGIARI
jgi:hypothetical protein